MTDTQTADWLQLHDKRMTAIVVDDLVMFAPNIGIWVPGCAGESSFHQFTDLERWPEIATVLAEAYDIDPDRLIRAIEIAIEHWGEVWDVCGHDMGTMTFEKFMEVRAAKLERRASELASRRERYLQRRRARYQQRKSQAAA
jgi:hypothetical protein